MNTNQNQKEKLVKALSLINDDINQLIKQLQNNEIKEQDISYKIDSLLFIINYLKPLTSSSINSKKSQQALDKIINMLYIEF
jgi:septal ring factor EnvC (AmiA/AmiB activator)